MSLESSSTREKSEKPPLLKSLADIEEPKKDAPAPGKEGTDARTGDTAAASTATTDKADPAKPTLDSAAQEIDRLFKTELRTALAKGDQEEIRKVYDRAVKQASMVPPEETEKARKDLIEVRKKMLLEENPEARLQLKREEMELFTKSRLLETTAGTAALWAFRNGHKEEGMGRLFQAAGVDVETINKHAGMSPEDIEALKGKVPNIGQSEIFDDIYFNRQMTRLASQGHEIPPQYFEIFNKVNADRNVENANLVRDVLASKEAPAAAAPETDAVAETPVLDVPAESVEGRVEPSNTPPLSGGEIDIRQRAAVEALQTLQPAKAEDRAKVVLTPEVLATLEKGMEAFVASKKISEDAVTKSNQALVAKYGPEKAQEYSNAATQVIDSLSTLRETGNLTEAESEALLMPQPDAALHSSALAKLGPEAQKGLETLRNAFDLNTEKGRKDYDELLTLGTAAGSARLTLDLATVSESRFRNQRDTTVGALTLRDVLAKTPPEAPTAEQKLLIENGIKADSTASRMALETAGSYETQMLTIMGEERYTKTADAYAALSGTAGKLLNEGKIKEEDFMALMDSDPANATKRQAARETLAKLSPDLVKQADDFFTAGGDKAALAFVGMQKFEQSLGLSMYLNVRSEKSANDYVAHLRQTGDQAGANAFATKYLQDIPAAERPDRMANSDLLKKMAADAGLQANGDAPATATTGGDVPASGLLSDAFGNPALPVRERVKELDEDSLKQMLQAVFKDADRGLENGKAAYEELIRRYTDKAFLDQNRNELTASQTRLQADIDARKKQEAGQTLTAAEQAALLTPQVRSELHAKNINNIFNLTYASEVKFNYAMYLGDAAGRNDIRTRALEKGPGEYQENMLLLAGKENLNLGVNQLASMQREANEAIKLADEMPRDLMAKEKALLEANFNATANQRAIADNLKVFNGDASQGRSALTDRAIEQRILLGMYYLNPALDRQEDARRMGKTSDELRVLSPIYKPQETLRLLTDAQNMYDKLHPGAKLGNEQLMQAIALAQKENPETFKALSDQAGKRYASAYADALGFVGAIGGDIAIAAIARKLGAPPAVAARWGLAGGIGGAVAGRTLGYPIFANWHFDSVENNLVHGFAIGGAYTVGKGANRVIERVAPTGNISGIRFAQLNGQEIAIRAAGADGVGQKFVETMRAQGEVADDVAARVIKDNAALMTKRVADMSTDELSGLYKQLGISMSNNALKGRLLQRTAAFNTADDTALANALKREGVWTGADVDALAVARNQRVGEVVDDLMAANASPTRGGMIREWFRGKPETTVDDLLSQLGKANPAKYTEAHMARTKTILETMGIKKVGDLQGFYMKDSIADVNNLMTAAVDAGLVKKSIFRPFRSVDTVRDNLEISSVVAQLKKNGGNDALVASFESRMPMLEAMGITKIGQLQQTNMRAMALKEMEEFSKQYPDLAANPNMLLNEFAGNNYRAFGLNGSPLRTEMEAMMGLQGAKAESSVANFLWRDRFYNAFSQTGRERNYTFIHGNSPMANIEKAAAQMDLNDGIVKMLAASSIYRSSNAYDLMQRDPSMTAAQAFEQVYLGTGNNLWDRLTTSAVASDVLMGSIGSRIVTGAKSSAIFWGGYGLIAMSDGSGYDLRRDYYAQSRDNMLRPLKDAVPLNTGLVTDTLPAARVPKSDPVPKGDALESDFDQFAPPAQ